MLESHGISKELREVKVESMQSIMWLVNKGYELEHNATDREVQHRGLSAELS